MIRRGGGDWNTFVTKQGVCVCVCFDKYSNSELTILESHRSLAKQDKLNKTTILSLLMLTASVIQEEYIV
jgi:hypothetical protein